MNIARLRAQQIPVNTVPRASVPFHMLIKPIGAGCNLACHYCYYPQLDQAQKMDEALLERFIRQYIASQPRYSREINFVWQGGEPLLAGIGFYKQALALQQKYAPPGVRISNSLQTNGTLLNAAWCRLFKQHQFIIGVSLDGDRQIQDAHRPDKRGNSSYDAALRGIALLQQHQIEFNLLVVVHDGVADRAQAMYDHLVALGVRYLQFQPLMLEGDAPAAGYGLSSANWGRFMVAIYRRWRSQRHIGQVFIMNIEHAYAQYFTHVSPNCVHAERCGGNLVMEPDGSVYACDHLIDANHHLGRFDHASQFAEYVDAATQMDFGKTKSLRRECQSCSVKSVCQGGCPAHIGQDRYNRLCAGYYAFFSEVLAPLRSFPRSAQGAVAWRNSVILPTS
ncbi:MULTISPECIES: anaerobic sulfatase maturase [unclassified Serratia (in: enterobacteria)]|uniref:anaerobic sulfatase maturase n=1 Tax=unclassified Serratia (in: enterobacteria) TaxID=2647522 RepID=UPI0030763EAD